MIALGVGSKSHVRELIRAGRVSVGGAVVTRFAEPVEPGQHVFVDDEPVLDPGRRAVLLMHKPKKHATALIDAVGADGRDLSGLARYLPLDAPRVFPVGRLDVNTTGALIFTNDGELARRVLHPDWSLPKRYEVKVRGHIPEDHPALDRMRSGMTVGPRSYRPVEVRWQCYRTRATWIELVLREGKNRQIRRMCAASRFQIVKLRRVAVGPIELGDLNPRCVRELSQAEVNALDEAVGLERRG